LIGWSAQIWPMKSTNSAIQGFDSVLLSRVFCILQIFTICRLRALNHYITIIFYPITHELYKIVQARFKKSENHYYTFDLGVTPGEQSSNKYLQTCYFKIVIFWFQRAQNGHFFSDKSNNFNISVYISIPRHFQILHFNPILIIK
jgi:hypothetical protein